MLAAFAGAKITLSGERKKKSRQRCLSDGVIDSAGIESGSGVFVWVGGVGVVRGGKNTLAPMW